MHCRVDRRSILSPANNWEGAFTDTGKTFIGKMIIPTDRDGADGKYLFLPRFGPLV
jgi:hypothetical protein